jgi:DNA invertase Pin-like site-specific DNA recombinase
MFEDREASGADEDRPGLWAAIDALAKGDVLLVYKLDRLARNVYLAEMIRRAVAVAGGRIEAVMGDVEGDGPESVMIRQVLASIAEYERKIIALRTKFAMLHHQRNGRRMGRYAPYGFEIDALDSTRLVPVEAEQEAVARILALHADGRNALNISQTLNAEGVPARSGGKWNRKTVAKIIGRGGVA